MGEWPPRPRGPRSSPQPDGRKAPDVPRVRSSPPDLTACSVSMRSGPCGTSRENPRVRPRTPTSQPPPMTPCSPERSSWCRLGARDAHPMLCARVRPGRTRSGAGRRTPRNPGGCCLRGTGIALAVGIDRRAAILWPAGPRLRRDSGDRCLRDHDSDRRRHRPAGSVSPGQRLRHPGHRGPGVSGRRNTQTVGPSPGPRRCTRRRP